MRIHFQYMLLLSMLSFVAGQTLAQLEEITCGTTAEHAQQSYLGSPTNVVRNGGKEITTQGILRVLVIYVRFVDDTRVSSDWPDYNVLPPYSQYFVDPSVPQNGIYTPGSMSDFIDRASGGDGSGSLGNLKVIGDVYYVTTDQPRSSYLSDFEVHQNVIAKLDDPNGKYNVNFALYDEWTFMSGGFFVHSNLPDGIVDYIFINWRDCSISSNPDCRWGGIKTIWTSYNTNDVNENGQPIQIVPTSGGTAYRMFDWGGPFDADNNAKENTIYYPGEEFFHYVYGGNHIDENGLNVGNVQNFSLMTANASGNLCAFERYRAGWLIPDIIAGNHDIRGILDTHINNEAMMIPIRRDNNDNIIEYFLIENYHTINDYTSANLFLERSLFGRPFTKGLLVYHIEDEHLIDAMSSHLDIECADGLWDWTAVQGASTPLDRTDDLIGHVTPSYQNSFDERDFISITIGSTLWTDHQALKAFDNSCGIGNPCNAPCTALQCNHGWRYTKSSYLGDNEDFFRENESDVFNSFSNPSTFLADGITNSHSGFEIVSYNATSKEYFLRVAVDDSSVQNMKPSKPQNPLLSSNNGQYGNIRFSWTANQEPDLASYEVSRKVDLYGNVWQVMVAATTNTYWVDPEFLYAPGGGDFVPTYRVRAKDNQAKYSSYSDEVSVRAELLKIALLDEDKPKEFSLRPGFPNPFNPSTQIRFDLAEASNVTLVIYDILGRQVAELVKGEVEAGYHSIIWNASSFASGIYLARFIATHANGAVRLSTTQKLLLTK